MDEVAQLQVPDWHDGQETLASPASCPDQATRPGFRAWDTWMTLT